MIFETIQRPATPVPPGPIGHWPKPTFGQKAAEAVARLVGSWTFIIGQSVVLVVWVTLNVLAFLRHWDPYPFLLLNVILSLQAAYTAPMILMAQNRQAEYDRAVLHYNYQMMAEVLRQVAPNTLQRVTEQPHVTDGQRQRR
jgi:uncharacterized membrane protein